MARTDKLKSTTVNLFESDIKILERRGISISDAVRGILHHIITTDSSDILYCVRHGQSGEQLKSIDQRIQRLLKDRDKIDREREWIDNKINELEDLKDVLQHNIKAAAIEHEYNENIRKVINLGLDLDKIIYQCNFDEEKIREMGGDSVEEMERLNPGWSLSTHIGLRKKLFNNR